MRVRIIRVPYGEIFGMNLSRFRVDHVYDLAPALAEFLILEKFAVSEMREHDEPSLTHDNRRKRR